MGFLFLVLYPAAFSSSSSRRRPHTPLTPPVISHTTCHHTTHTQLNSHTACSHTCSHTTQLTQLAPISHIQLVIIQLAHIPHTPLTPPVITHTTCHHTTHTQLNSRNLLTYHTYNLSSYNLLTSLTHHLLLPSSHIQLVIIQLDHIPHTPLTPPVITHTTCHHTTHTQLNSHTHTTCSHTTQLTQLAHTQLNSHTTCSHITHTTCHHTICSHTTQLTHNLPTHTTCHQTTCSHTTWRHPPSFHVAGVALGHIHIRFTWQAWHLRHWAGSGGAPGSRLTPWTPRLFAWQAWHLVTSTFTLRGRRGTWSHPHSFHVAGVAITALGGLWWRTGFSADAVDAVALCVAGVALGGVWHLVTSTFVSRGRRGTYGTGRALVAHRVLG